MPAFGRSLSLLAAIVIAGTLFHPLSLAAVFAAVWWAARNSRRQVLTGAVLLILLVLGVCAKNWLVFETFGTTSWYGIGLARMTGSKPA